MRGDEVQARTDRVRLLEADPDLGRWLTPDEVVAARARSIVPVLRVRAGPWVPADCEERRAHLGFLVLDGLVARDELLAGGRSTELLGPGELIQPWTQRPQDVFVPRRVRFTALQATRLAVLGQAFTAATAPWPALRSALLDRAMQRCTWLSTEHALSQLSRVDARLLVLLWHMAERWGRVVAGGVVLPLRLSHDMLGHLAGAKRPTVTLALGRLTELGLIVRRPDGSWMLIGDPEQGLRRLDDHDSGTPVSARQAAHSARRSDGASRVRAT